MKRCIDCDWWYLGKCSSLEWSTESCSYLGKITTNPNHLGKYYYKRKWYKFWREK